MKYNENWRKVGKNEVRACIKTCGAQRDAGSNLASLSFILHFTLQTGLHYKSKSPNKENKGIPKLFLFAV